MKKHIWEQYNNQSEMENGKDVTMLEMQTIYNSLLNEYKGIANDIVDSVDCNDYVKLSMLIDERKQVLAAINEMETLYGDKLFIYRNGKKRIADGLTKSAYFADSRGEETLRSVFTGFEKLNDAAHTITEKTLNSTAKAINVGNQINYKVTRNLLTHTTNSLLKLADIFKK